MPGWIARFQANMAVVASFGASMWLTAWTIRRRLDTDKPLDNRTKMTQIALVLSCWTAASLPLEPGVVSGIVRGIFALAGCAVLWWPNLALRVAMRIWKTDFDHVYDVLERWDPLGLADAEAGQVAYRPYVAEVLDGLEKGTDAPTLARMLGRFRAEWSRDVDPDGDYRVAEGLAAWWRSRKHARAAA